MNEKENKLFEFLKGHQIWGINESEIIASISSKINMDKITVENIFNSLRTKNLLLRSSSTELNMDGNLSNSKISYMAFREQQRRKKRSTSKKSSKPNHINIIPPKNLQRRKKRSTSKNHFRCPPDRKIKNEISRGHSSIKEKRFPFN